MSGSVLQVLKVLVKVAIRVDTLDLAIEPRWFVRVGTSVSVSFPFRCMGLSSVVAL